MKARGNTLHGTSRRNISKRYTALYTAPQNTRGENETETIVEGEISVTETAASINSAGRISDTY